MKIKKMIFIPVLACVSLPAIAWNYQESTDKMRNETTKYASITSSNKVSFGFPYQGGSTMELTIRKSPKYGKDIVIEISSGQFTCMMGCTIHMKFDNGKIERFSANGAADGSSDVIFAKPFGAILTKLQKAKKLVVEADFYNEGANQFEFNVSGLNWK